MRSREPPASRVAALIVSAGLFISSAIAPTTIIIQANEAAAHINQYATVQGVVARCSHPKAATRSSISALLIPTRLSQAGFRRITAQGKLTVP